MTRPGLIFFVTVGFVLSGCPEYKFNGNRDAQDIDDTDAQAVPSTPSSGVPTLTDSVWSWGTGTTTSQTTGSGSGTGTSTGTTTQGTTTGGGPTGGPGTGSGSSGTGSGAGTGGPGSGTGSTTWTSTPDTSSWDTCDWAAHVAYFLDPLQTPNDGHVLFCHSSSGNNYTFVDSSVSSCNTHIGHRHDIFPTTICDT